MAILATWLQQQLEERQLTRQAAAVYAVMSGATVSDLINHGHLPHMEILFRLADYFDTPRDYVLRLAARVPLDDREIEAALRRAPDEWRRELIRLVDMFNRMGGQPLVLTLGRRRRHKP